MTGPDLNSTASTSNSSVQTQQAWHSLSVETICQSFSVQPENGLDSNSVQKRLHRFGKNRIQQKVTRTVFQLLFDQFRDILVLILLAAALISGLIGEWTDALVVLIIVIMNSIIGFIQQYRAEKAIAMLKSMTAPTAQVIRESLQQKIAAEFLVPGDIILLEAGNIVPADVRLLVSNQLTLDESALTGESTPVNKHAEVMSDSNVVLAERQNMAYKGTLVTQGNARAIVVATGMHSELGRIAGLLESSLVEKTPLQQRLKAFSKHLALFILAICLLVFVFGLLRGEEILLMFLTAISMAVAAIPEALPALVTVSLAIGARKLARQHALIRTLPAVETLGSITYICSDKTGTLTQNKMKVERYFVDSKISASLDADSSADSQKLSEAMAISNNIFADQHHQFQGDPTEIALVEAIEKSGARQSHYLTQLPRLFEIPFDATRKRMSTLHAYGDGSILYCKGSPESVLAICQNESSRKEILQVAESMASEGY